MDLKDYLSVVSLLPSFPRWLGTRNFLFLSFHFCIFFRKSFLILTKMSFIFFIFSLLHSCTMRSFLHLFLQKTLNFNQNFISSFFFFTVAPWGHFCIFSLKSSLILTNFFFLFLFFFIVAPWGNFWIFSLNFDQNSISFFFLHLISLP